VFRPHQAAIYRSGRGALISDAVDSFSPRGRGIAIPRIPQPQVILEL
jgi:hypothetical protein